MINYSPIYRKFIDDRNRINPNQMVRGKFYLIKKYEYVDGTKGSFVENAAPIIFTLFVSKTKDIVHAVKVSTINPQLIKRFFGKFINDETEKLEMKGGAKSIYKSIVSKVPIVTNDAYRTYKLSGLENVIELKMDVNELTPKNKNVIGIDSNTQKQNK
jgi:hypothetical protein